MKRNDEFPVLSGIAAVLNVFGWLLAVAGIVVFWIGVGSIVNGTMGETTGIMLVAAGVALPIFGIGVVMVAELTGVLFAIEKNGRATPARYIEPSRQTPVGASGSGQEGESAST